MAGTFDNVNFQLLGQSEGVRDWQSLQVLATFDDDNNQANITTSELTFVNPMAQAILDHIDNGLNGLTNGIFEGIDFSMRIDQPNTDVFEGVLDLADDITVNRDLPEVKSKLMKLEGLNTFSNVSQAVTMQLLIDEGYITSSDYVDIPYIKETDFEFMTSAMLVISILTIRRELEEIATRIVTDVAEVLTWLTTTIPSPIASGVWLGVKILINTTYFFLMLKVLKDTVIELLELLIAIKKYHRGIKFKTILEKSAQIAGYTFSSTITELEDLYLLPRKTTKGWKFIASDQTGVPVSGGNLYTASQNYGLAKDLFKAKLKIINGVLHLEPKNNTGFWERASGYVMPDVKVDIERYNTDEMVATKVISFSTDSNDLFTLENFKGTVYEISTRPNSATDQNKVLLKGVEQITFPVALGTRKEDLNLAEKSIRLFARWADKLKTAFGGSANWEAKIIDRTNILKMSNDLVDVPKLMRLNSSLNLASDYRTNWSAKYLYDNYHNNDSFVLNGFGGQYKLYRKIRMNATFQDFLTIVDNNVGSTADGKTVKFESILYNFAGGFWEADYKIQEPYTKNLKETYTEPE